MPIFNFTAVQTRLVLDLTETKSLIGISVSTYDDILQIMLDSAKEAADNYMNNPFLNDDGTDGEIPSKVKLGVVRWVAMEFREGFPSAPVTSGVAGPLKRWKTAKEEEEYASGASIEFQYSLVMDRYWSEFRLLPNDLTAKIRGVATSDLSDTALVEVDE